ncbi:MAG: hypothetical protein WBD40_22735 [Tepidisphaeraceae bacterium]
MGWRVWTAIGSAVLCVSADVARAEGDSLQPMRLSDQPLRLMAQSDYESVYAPPDPILESTGVNEGSVRFDLAVSYLSDYVYRGIEESQRIAGTRAEGDVVGRPDFSENAANIQIDAKMTFDLGKAPHPFVGVFVNTFDADPESQFQEIRPFVGLEWTLRPIIFTVGHNSYIYPDRDQINTTEVFGQITVDDSYFFRTDEPILSPYIYAAYDYDLYDATYIEMGVQHDFVLEGTGIVLTAQASVAYVDGYELFAEPGAENDSGFQHYQFGLIGSYRLNPLLNIPQRYGDWTFKGYLYYTDGIENDLRADTQVWGGAGIGFSY